MKSGMDSRAQSAGGVNQSRSRLHGGIASRVISLLRHVLMQDLPQFLTPVLVKLGLAQSDPHFFRRVWVQNMTQKFVFAGCALLLGLSATVGHASSPVVTPIFWWLAGFGDTGPGPYSSTLDPGGNCESCLQASGGYHWNGVLTPLGYGSFYETNFPFNKFKGCQFIQDGGATQDNGCVVTRGEYCPVGYQVEGDSCSFIGPQNPLKNNGAPPPCQGPVGNPINQGNGNKFQVETDYVGIARPTLKIQRFYNSSVVMLGAELGANWRTNYDRALSLSSTQNLATVTAYRPDGKAYFFTQISGIWTPDSEVDPISRTPYCSCRRSPK